MRPGTLLRSTLLAALIAALPLPLAASGTASTPTEVRPTPTAVRWSVDAGTTGLLVEDHRAPLVTVQLRFPAGTWSPWAEQSGADLAFRIQSRDPTGTLRQRADRLAAPIGLSVAPRWSTLSVTCLKEDLPAVLQLVRDVLANRDFDRAELARRRQATDLEWKASLKQPRFMGLQAGARMLYGPDDPRRKAYEAPDDPLSDPVKLATARDTLVRLPGRSIGFAGALTADEAQQFAATILPPPLTEAPAGRAPALTAPQAPGSRPREIDLPMARLTQVYFGYGREGLSLLDPAEPASVIADHALGGHFNSRLMTTLRQEGGDTYGAGVVDLGGIDPGLYALATFTRTGNAAAVETKLRDVLARLHRDGLTEEERALAAGNAVGSRAALRETPQQVLYTAMDEHSLDLPNGFFDARAARAAALTLEQVNDFVRRFYDPAGFTMIRARPE